MLCCEKSHHNRGSTLSTQMSLACGRRTWIFSTSSILMPVMYVASYMLKSEKSMGELLKQVSKECGEQIRTQLRRLGSVFLNHQKVSAQEAVYRILSLPLKQLSRKAIFVNTGLKDRVSVLKPIGQIQNTEDDSEDIYQTSLIDRNSVMERPTIRYLYLRMETTVVVNAFNSRTVLGTCTSVDERPSFAFTSSIVKRNPANYRSKLML